VSGVVGVLLVPVTAWTALRIIGIDAGWWWIAAVAFTPYVAVISLVPLFLAVMARLWRLVVVALVMSALLASAVVPRQLADTAPETHGPALRVLAANLAVGAGDTATLLDLIAQLKPDVLTLQELTPAAKKRLEDGGLKKRMPHVVDRSQNGVTGSGIYSVHPLTEQPLIALGRFRQARAVVQVAGGPAVEITSVHPCAPARSERVA